MRAGLQASGIRGASVAVVRGTRLVAARGYTWAEPGYPTVLPETVFRIASVSKTVTALAVQQLIEQNRLALGDRLGALLPITAFHGGPQHPDFAAITVQELLEHRSGVMAGVSEGAVHAAFGGLARPVGWFPVARFVAGQPLAAPTKPLAYNNLGYWLLGLVVAFRGDRQPSTTRSRRGSWIPLVSDDSVSRCRKCGRAIATRRVMTAWAKPLMAQGTGVPGS